MYAYKNSSAMNADRSTTSLGDLNTIPSTPRDTPTSAHFPPSVFETPNANQSSLNDLSGWTPRFAEEYSVFNTIPGSLRGVSGPFPGLAVATPYQATVSHKRLLSAGSLAADIASHVNHHSPASALPLPPVDPSHRLSSSPTAARPFPSPIEASTPRSLQPRSSKKARGEALIDTKPRQAITPPPSARKGERRLAPKPQAITMQHEEFESEFVADASHQQHMLAGFGGPSIEMFGMPLSAPATSTTFEDTQGYWDTGMSGMDIDFSIPTTDSFHGAHHRQSDSLDWGKTNEMFREASGAPPTSQEIPPQKKGRLLAPKPVSVPNVDTSMTEAPMLAHSFHIPADNPFPPSNAVGGVDPGLLYSRPPSSHMELASFDPMAQPIVLNPLPSPQLPPPKVKEPKRGQVRRPASSKDASRTKKEERTAISRPGLLRSASETRGGKSVSRAGTVPGLAPGVRNGLPTSGARSASQGSRASGRTSPLKIHQRLSSLTSIPEHNAPRTRTSVRFTIDSRGRARAETTVVEDGEKPVTKTRRRRRERKNEWESSDDDSSSTDEEPIIIPSRTASFALPDSRPPSYVRPSHTSHRSFGDQGSASLGIYYAEPISNQGDADSDAETIMNAAGGSNGRGDAMSELRKVRENRQKRIPTLNTSNFPMSSAPFSTGSTTSTPSTDCGNQIRCVCNTTLSHINGDGYMVQCESCEMWLHGKCVKITRQTLPRVYICAFCANTPNARVRGRGAQRGLDAQSNSKSTTSPLAHKSLRSFR